MGKKKKKEDAVPPAFVKGKTLRKIAKSKNGKQYVIATVSKEDVLMAIGDGEKCIQKYAKLVNLIEELSDEQMEKLAERMRLSVLDCCFASILRDEFNVVIDRNEIEDDV